MTGDLDPLIGQVFQNTYRIERLIGQGGMGAVYEASHLRVEKRFAIKLLLPQIAEEPGVLKIFRREAQISSRLGHPHIIEVIDFNFAPNGAPYIVMELLQGEDLGERICRLKYLTLEEVASIFRQTSSALHAAHQQGIVHRDLKPQNIFLCRRGERNDFVKIVDFGISIVLGSKTTTSERNILVGTPCYMAPEQVAEKLTEHIDSRTDVYALGIILYEMLIGINPFAGPSAMGTLFKTVYEEPTPLRSLRPDLPELVEYVIHKALRKDMSERYRSMDGFWKHFQKAIAQKESSFDDPTEDREVEKLEPTLDRLEEWDAPTEVASYDQLELEHQGDLPLFDDQTLCDDPPRSQAPLLAVASKTDEVKLPRSLLPKSLSRLMKVIFITLLIIVGLGSTLIFRLIDKKMTKKNENSSSLTIYPATVAVPVKRTKVKNRPSVKGKSDSKGMMAPKLKNPAAPKCEAFPLNATGTDGEARGVINKNRPLEGIKDSSRKKRKRVGRVRRSKTSPVTNEADLVIDEPGFAPR
jgi:serine/threonine protein kinase